jgi:hypothetical protein
LTTLPHTKSHSIFERASANLALKNSHGKQSTLSKSEVPVHRAIEKCTFVPRENNKKKQKKASINE